MKLITGFSYTVNLSNNLLFNYIGKCESKIKLLFFVTKQSINKITFLINSESKCYLKYSGC